MSGSSNAQMTIQTRFYNDDDILIVEISADPLSVGSDDILASWTVLLEAVFSKVASAFKRSEFNVPLIAVDLTQVRIADETDEWLLWDILRRNQVLGYVHDREGKLVFIGNETPSVIKRHSKISTALTLDEAVAVLQKYKAQLRTDNELSASEVASRLGTKKLFLAGCPEMDLGDLPDEFREFGIEVETADAISDGSHVVFCISAANGPSPGTRQSVKSCGGKTIVPIAIVLTHSDAVDDNSLRELVSMEERELLLEVLPDDTVNKLPCLLDLAPNLVTQIVDLAMDNSAEVKCKDGPQ